MRALRDKLAAEIDGCESSRDVAALSARLMDVLAQIDAVEKPRISKRDELARKRAERQRKAAAGRPDAADSGGTASGDKRGG
ncbi:hypothetical protein BMW24_003525 [Mycobacterium heckeshornense]|nr:hypothetical protein BMW24_003240 [Mycobacterium heckeshornense]PIJ37096.1 hypothetical protein BMW24_003525 [Mycobacterium heckeshornense]